MPLSVFRRPVVAVTALAALIAAALIQAPTADAAVADSTVVLVDPAFGNGYLMVAQDGGVFNYSDRPFSGSLGNNPPANPIVSIAALN